MRSLQFRTVKFACIILSVFTVYACPLQAQLAIKGRVIYADGKPAAFASVKLIDHTNGTVSDAAGNFALVMHNLKQNDTLLISSIGYENFKIPAQKATQLSEFRLQEAQKTLESVVVRSFSKEEIAGAKTENVGYFRSWNTDNTGGEIGRTV